MDCLIALDPDTARGYMGDGCGRLLAESESRDPAQAAIEEQLADTLPVTFRQTQASGPASAPDGGSRTDVLDLWFRHRVPARYWGDPSEPARPAPPQNAQVLQKCPFPI